MLSRNCRRMNCSAHRKSTATLLLARHHADCNASYTCWRNSYKHHMSAARTHLRTQIRIMLTSMWMRWPCPRIANPLPRSTQLSKGIPKSSDVERPRQTPALPPERRYCQSQRKQHRRNHLAYPDEKRLDDCKRWIIAGPLIFRFCIHQHRGFQTRNTCIPE